jgi:uncharacterized protein (DUF488 family)
MLDFEPHIFTVGHSDNSIDWFIELLRMHGITALADVRSHPFSQFTPQFNRDELKVSLRAARVCYVSLGRELGARRNEATCYVDGKARYELIAKTPLFRAGLDRVRQGTEVHRIALMCAEKDPITCHRAILVSRHLRGMGIPISHILQSGDLETNEAMEHRLVAATGHSEADLFSDEATMIEYAYEVQGDRIAYVQQPVAADEGG